MKNIMILFALSFKFLSYRRRFIDSLEVLLSKYYQKVGKMKIEVWNLLCFIHWFKYDVFHKPFLALPSRVEDLKKYYNLSKNHLPSTQKQLLAK